MQDRRPPLIQELLKTGVYNLDEVLFRGETMRALCEAQDLAPEIMRELEANARLRGSSVLTNKDFALGIANDSFLKRKCGNCRKDLSKKVDRKGLCSHCKCIYYCSAECQRRDWEGSHKLCCKDLRA